MEIFKEILFCLADPCMKGYNAENSFEENFKKLEQYTSSKHHYKHARLTMAFAHVNNINSTIHDKFRLIGSCINNKFDLHNNPDNYLDTFCKAQRLYHSLSKFAFNYKYKKSKIQNQEDMMMTPICEEDTYAVTIYENNNRYVFRMSEILNIVKTSLCNYIDGLEYIEPKPVKNPYTNIPFTKSSLYKMYFEASRNTVRIPELFRHYYLCDFSLSKLYNEHNPFLTKMAIKDFIKNSPINMLSYKCKEMLLDIEEFDDVDFKFSISPGFDKTLLVNILKPYLELYLITEHSNDNFYSNCCMDELKYKLKLLYTNNPTFGRKLTRTIKGFNEEITKVHRFSTDYIPYQHGSTTNNYDESHSYHGFINDVEYRLDDDIFDITRNNRINRYHMRGQMPPMRQMPSVIQPTAFPPSQMRRPNNNTIYRTYNFIDSDAEEAMENDDDTITISSVGSIHRTGDNDTLADENEEDDLGSFTSDDEVARSLANDYSAENSDDEVARSLANDYSAENIEPEEGEIVTDESLVAAGSTTNQELKDLSTRIRDLIEGDNILLVDGWDRVLFLLAQIDNLNSNN